MTECKKRDPKKARVTLPRYDVIGTNVKLTYKGVPNSEEFYNILTTTYPYLKKYTPRQIKDYIKKCNEFAGEKAVTTREGIRLPENLGDLLGGVFLFKATARQKRMSVDFNASEKLGKVVRHLNLHSDGRKGKIVYSVSKPGVRNSPFRYWKLDAARNIKKKFSEGMKKDWTMYYVMSSAKFVKRKPKNK